jgi:hypothetical protein
MGSCNGSTPSLPTVTGDFLSPASNPCLSNVACRPLLGDDYTFQKAVRVRAYASCLLGVFCSPCHVRWSCSRGACLVQVFYTSFFPVFCSPPILWAARS